MKKFTTTTFFLFLVCCALSAQSCLPEGIRFTTQGQVDSFGLQYPGCHSITGDVFIDSTFITDLSGLQVLDSIEKDLNIHDMLQLTSLQGLQNLHSIGGGFYLKNTGVDSLPAISNLHLIGGSLKIEGNVALQNLAGLGALTAIGGEVLINNNSLLTNLAGLSHVQTIGLRLVVQDNPLLNGLGGLSNLASLGTDLTILNCPGILNFNGLQGLTALHGNLSITNGSGGIQSFSGMENVVAISGALTVQSSGLTSLVGLDKVTTIGGGLLVANTAVENFTGLDKLVSVGGSVNTGGPALKSFAGLGKLVSTGNFTVSNTTMLEDFTGLNSLITISGILTVSNNAGLKDFSGIEQVATLKSLSVGNNASLLSFTGLNVTSLTNFLSIGTNPLLTNLQGLNNLVSIGGFFTIASNPVLTNFSGLDNLKTIAGAVKIQNNPLLINCTGLGNLQHIAGTVDVYNNTSQVNFTGMDQLQSIQGVTRIYGNPAMTTLSGLGHLEVINSDLFIDGNNSLVALTGLESLQTVSGHFYLDQNNILTDISPLNNLQTTNSLIIFGNHSLSACNIYSICYRLQTNPNSISIDFNAVGCNSAAEVEFSCGALPVIATVLLDNNADCHVDSSDARVERVLVKLSGNQQQVIRPTLNDGTARFGYLESNAFSLSLPDYPSANWAVCQDTFWFLPDTIQDTIRTTFLLQPLNQCPELTVDLQLPPAFRGCLATSPVQVTVQNSGTVIADSVQVAVVLPAELLLVSSVPTLATQHGDTLFFALGAIPPLATGIVNLVVRTECGSFLLGQTICLEAFAGLSNPCAVVQDPFSEVRLFSQCVSDTTVRFTLKNVGDAATQGMHDYVIIEDEVILMQTPFNLAEHASMDVDIPATGATYRMEATKFDDGTQTAIARENCGGLTPGFITAYWLNEGRHNYDFDCRQVVGAYDPNEKTAIPTGVGPEHLLAANKSIQYTIEFQNTGTDTAFRVLVRDILPPQLAINTFRAGFSSNPYTWQILGGDTLEVLFQPIMLPDSNVNEAASHGWFSFEMEQKPNLPDGTTIQNSAAIVFDYNPPIVTNTVWHTIGKLTVSVDEPQAPGSRWQVLSNPARYAATFRSLDPSSGLKRFELSDGLGRVVRTEHFEGREFEFRRERLPAGLYYFRIYDGQGRVSSGKIVLSQ
ncbi:MAG: hypothetical protein ABIO24_09845 [Saprospiraceae bacterium]